LINMATNNNGTKNGERPREKTLDEEIEEAFTLPLWMQLSG